MIVAEIEFWPDYGAGPLWRAGRSVEPEELGLPPELAARLSARNARYEESRIPVDGSGDAAWLAEGIALLAEVRAAAQPEYAILVTEPWWGEEPGMDS